MISLATGQYTILCARTQVSDQGHRGPLALKTVEAFVIILTWYV